MARLVNFLLVGSALAALIGGAVLLGSHVRGDAVSRLTESVPAEAAAATADSQLRTAVFAANVYFLRRSTYVGMTADALRADVDGGIAPKVSVADAGSASYCVETVVAERVFSYRVRKGVLAPGSGC
ncbi:MAG: hypothetical protein ABIR67_02440 [Gaiellaceae bacterium]